MRGRERCSEVKARQIRRQISEPQSFGATNFRRKWSQVLISQGQTVCSARAPTSPAHRATPSADARLRRLGTRLRASFETATKGSKIREKCAFNTQYFLKLCKKKLFHTVQMYEKDEGFGDRVEFCTKNDRLIVFENHNLAFSYSFRF